MLKGEMCLRENLSNGFCRGTILIDVYAGVELVQQQAPHHGACPAVSAVQTQEQIWVVEEVVTVARVNICQVPGSSTAPLGR